MVTNNRKPVLDEVKVVVIQTLQLQARHADLQSDTRLLGNFPEFDSMAVVSLVTALEERYGFFVDDDEIEAETFATVGSLTAFVENKLSG